MELVCTALMVEFETPVVKLVGGEFSPSSHLSTTVLGVDEVTASPVATGTGTVRAAHGILPNPSPAAVRLLTGIPTYGRATGIELTTPTGAALLSALCTSFGPMPAMVVAATGFGVRLNG